MEAAAAMDFNALSRRELQALCKLNGVRANMTNLAMAEALQSLPSVDGIDTIGTTLCLPTPGKSAMKSVLKAEAAVGEDQQQHGSPLPRGRRVSVKSPEAIRMDVEDGEDEMKRDLIKDIVRTPGMALRSTSRRPRATPAPIPTPAAGNLRRSQRSTARKAAAPVEVEVSNTKRSTRRTKVVIDLDQEEDIPVAPAPEEVKMQEVEPKGVACDEKCDNPEDEEEVTGHIKGGSNKAEDGVASDEKCDDPEEEEVSGHLKEGNRKVEEPEQDEEVGFCVAPNGSADMSYADFKVEEEVVMREEKATMPHEETATGEEQELLGAEKSAPLAAMEDSPILGVLSKVEAVEPAIKNVGDGDASCNWSPVLEITDEINRASEDKEVAAVEVPKEDAFNSTREAADAPNKVLPAAVTDNETEKGEGLNEDKENSANEIPQTDLTDDDTTEEYDTDGEISEEAELTEESSEEGDIDEEAGMQKAFLTVDVATGEVNCTSETDEESDEIIEGSDSDEEAGMQKAFLTVDVATGEVNCTSETDEESDEIIEGSDSTDDSDEEEEEVLKEINGDGESGFTGEEDDFSADLSPEFANAGNFSDAETVSDSSPAAAAAAAASAAKAVVKSHDDSAITEDPEVSSEGDELSQRAAVTDKKLDTVVKSLDEFTITEELTEGKKEPDAVGAKEKSPSLRKLKSAYKDRLIALKEKERLALAKLDNNAGVDC